MSNKEIDKAIDEVTGQKKFRRSILIALLVLWALISLCININYIYSSYRENKEQEKVIQKEKEIAIQKNKKWKRFLESIKREEFLTKKEIYQFYCELEDGYSLCMTLEEFLPKNKNKKMEALILRKIDPNNEICAEYLDLHDKCFYSIEYFKIPIGDFSPERRIEIGENFLENLETGINKLMNYNVKKILKAK